MKNIVLWSILCALISTTIYSEPTQQGTLPPQTPNPISGLTTTQAPGQTIPSQATPSIPRVPQEVQNTPNTTPIIDCNYKIPAQNKKIDQPLVTNWSQNAVAQAFTFNPSSMDIQMQKLQACFTEQGWTGFNSALEKSGNLEAIKSQKLSVTSKIQGMTLVTEVKDNQWKVSVPLVVIYQNEKEKVSQLLSVDLTVSRKPTGDLGIMQMIATPRGTVTTKKPEEPPADPQSTLLDTHPAERDFRGTQQ